MEHGKRFKAPGPSGRAPAGGPRRAFAEGLVRPSGPALALSLGLCLAGFLACLLGVTPRSFVRLHPFFASERRDSDVFLSARAIELESRETLERLTIVLLGGSSLMSVVDPAQLEGSVTSATGLDLHTVSLMNLGQSLLDTASLTDVLPERLEGILVVGTSLVEICRSVNLSPGPEDPPVGSRFAFDSPTLEGHARKLGIEPPSSTGNYFWDHRRFFLPRMGSFLRNVLWRGPLQMNEHPWQTLDEAQPLQERREMGLRIQRLTELGYPAHSEDGLRLLGASLERVRGIEVLLLETPLAPMIVDEFVGREFLEEHRSRMRTFASERGFEYVSLDQEAQLEDPDFYDHTHVFREQAQQRFTVALARVLSERLLARAEEEDQ